MTLDRRAGCRVTLASRQPERNRCHIMTLVETSIASIDGADDDDDDDRKEIALLKEFAGHGLIQYKYLSLPPPFTTGFLLFKSNSTRYEIHKYRQRPDIGESNIQK